MLGTGRRGACVRRALPLAAALMIGFGIAAAAEEARYPDPKYPDWRGQWTRQVVPGVKGQPFGEATNTGICRSVFSWYSA